MLKDSTDALVWLNEIEEKCKKSNRHCTPFTFDFASLYDTLDPSLVIRAVRDAIRICRLEWSQCFSDWLIDLIRLSFDCSFGEFLGKFFRPKNGIATGGSISVELANITVYFVLKNVLFDDPSMMKDVIDVRRYIDDGVRVHTMSERQFTGWKKQVSKKVEKFGLEIKEEDWSVPPKKFQPINFLDISFSFDKNKQLQTDLFKKPTDSRSYLNFNSCHPNYMFSGIVKSQATRLRRIINDEDRLAIRLDELKKDFQRCGYPESMLEHFQSN